MNFLEENIQIGSNQMVVSHGGSLCALMYDWGLEEILVPGSVVGVEVGKGQGEFEFGVDFVWDHPKIDFTQE